MKQAILKIVVNGLIGVVTSVITLYLGGQAVEVVGASGVATAAFGQRVADATIAAFA